MDGRRQDIRRKILRCGFRALAGIFLIALATLISYVLGLNLSTVSFFYLIIIVLQALAGDLGSSALVSLVALFALDYFFAPPTLSFAVRDGMNIVALAAFLITGLVITRLTSDLRSEVKTSELQRVEVKRLYAVAQILKAIFMLILWIFYVFFRYEALLFVLP
jgi:two-component system sensor histidine kinase KdpD